MPITILQPMHTNLKLELLNIMILSSQGQVKIGMNYYCQQHPKHQFSLKCPLIQKQNVKYMHPTSSQSSSLFCLYNIKIKIKIKNTSGDDFDFERRRLVGKVLPSSGLCSPSRRSPDWSSNPSNSEPQISTSF